MSEEQTPYTTAGAPVVSDVTSGHLITTTCPHCHQALQVLISDDGRLLHTAHLTPEPDADSE